MKTLISKLFFFAVLIPRHSGAAIINGHMGYLIGGVIALLILGYLIYTLMRPEKF